MSEKFPVQKQTEGLPEGGSKSERPKRRKAPKLSDVPDDTPKKPNDIKSFVDMEKALEFQRIIQNNNIEEETVVSEENTPDVVIEEPIAVDNEKVDQATDTPEAMEAPHEVVVEKKKGNLRKQGEIVLDRFKKAEEEAVAKENRKKDFEERRKTSRGNSPANLGSLSFRNKASEALKKASENDPEPETIGTGNKRFANAEEKTARANTRKATKNTFKKVDWSKEEPISMLPDSREITGIFIPKEEEEYDDYVKPAKRDYKNTKENPITIEFHEDEYDPKGPKGTELPDIDSILGKEMEFEGKKTKSSVEVAMNKTQESADLYHETKLKRKDVSSAKTIDELLERIDGSSGIEGQTGITFSAKDLKDAIMGVQKGELGYEYITRSGGLRQKVFDLLNQAEEETVEEIVESKKEEVPIIPVLKPVKMTPPPLPKDSLVGVEESVVPLGDTPDILGRKKTKKADFPKPEDFRIGEVKKLLFTPEKNGEPIFNEKPTKPTYKEEQFLKKEDTPEKISYLNDELETIKTATAEADLETILAGKKRKSKALKEAEGDFELANVALIDLQNRDAGEIKDSERGLIKKIKNWFVGSKKITPEQREETRKAYIKAFEKLLDVVVEEEFNKIIANGYENVDLEVDIVDIEKSVVKNPAINAYFKNSKSGYSSKISIREIIMNALDGKFNTADIKQLIKTKIRPDIRNRLVEEINRKNKVAA